MRKTKRKYQRVSNKKKSMRRRRQQNKTHKQVKQQRRRRQQNKTHKQLKQSRQRKTRKYRKKGGGGAFNLTTDEFFQRLFTVYSEVQELLESIECPNQKCGEYLITGRTICIRHEDDERGQLKNVGCGKSITTELQTKLLKIRGNYITPEGELNDNDGDYVDFGVVYYKYTVYTLYEIFLLIEDNDKELMDTKIMEDVNKYLNGKLSFEDLCEKTFKNMKASQATISQLNISMSDLGEKFEESYESGEVKESHEEMMEEMRNEYPINEVIDEAPSSPDSEDIMTFPDFAQQNNL
jgi:hypothetical protein